MMAVKLEKSCMITVTSCAENAVSLINEGEFGVRAPFCGMGHQKMRENTKKLKFQQRFIDERL
jgi:hypothetical protein